MSELKLFTTGETVKERVSSEVMLEKELQNLIEKHMETFFGVRFLKSEYAITNGRMDSIGLDENNCPVIFEYKRSQNENVINQGLFYLDWLLDHKADFKLLVIERLGMEVAESIDWSVPCVICIAHDFTKYDIHAVNQMQRNIKLVSYRRYDHDLILFEHLNAPVIHPTAESINSDPDAGKSFGKTHLEKVNSISGELKMIYHSICDFIESLGDDVVQNQLKYYLAYKKVQNLACIEIHDKKITICLKLNPDSIVQEKDFTRDMRGVGHYGTGDLQITVRNTFDFEKAKPLIERAYLEA